MNASRASNGRAGRPLARWITLGALLVLVLAARVAGVDPVLALLHLAAAIGGPDAPSLLVARGLVWHHLAVRTPSFTVVTALLLIPVLWCEPGGFPRRRFAVLLLGAVLLPLWPLLFRSAPSLVRWLPVTQPAPGGGTWVTYPGTEFVVATVGGAVLGWATRSWRVAVAALLVSGASVLLLPSLRSLGLPGGLDVSVGLAVLFNLVVVTVAWLDVAARRRRAALPDEPCCARCGYPRHGLPQGSTCPECGAVA